jgi:hypothetical protein
MLVLDDRQLYGVGMTDDAISSAEEALVTDDAILPAEEALVTDDAIFPAEEAS